MVRMIKNWKEILMTTMMRKKPRTCKQVITRMKAKVAPRTCKKQVSMMMEERPTRAMISMVTRELQNMHEAIDHEEWDDDNDYLSTNDFRVYKIDVQTGNFLKLQRPDQILCLTDYGSMSLQASDFKELEKNGIYFATNGTSDTIVSQPFTSRENRCLQPR
ncbi:hypothetical protein C1H46_000559 [Malus baccata]|uniref:DUF295 domain-containing protein n=1 Tax=Malus baccata TaxID=106549 RepID=A0A540NSB3_MALBA|nr:hypothetical protein C1H46_000559 [Malus baccata]